jgi:hypothetical protein
MRAFMAELSREGHPLAERNRRWLALVPFLAMLLTGVACAATNKAGDLLFWAGISGATGGFLAISVLCLTQKREGR